MSVINAEYDAKARLLSNFATSRDGIARRLADLVPTTARSIEELLDCAPHRHAEMTVQLLERALELRRRARQIGGDVGTRRCIGIDIRRHGPVVALAGGELRDFVALPCHASQRGGRLRPDSAAALVERFRSGGCGKVAKRPVHSSSSGRRPDGRWWTLRWHPTRVRRLRSTASSSRTPRCRTGRFPQVVVPFGLVCRTVASISWCASMTRCRT